MRKRCGWRGCTRIHRRELFCDICEGYRKDVYQRTDTKKQTRLNHLSYHLLAEPNPVFGVDTIAKELGVEARFIRQIAQANEIPLRVRANFLSGPVYELVREAVVDLCWSVAQRSPKVLTTLASNYGQVIEDTCLPAASSRLEVESGGEEKPELTGLARWSLTECVEFTGMSRGTLVNLRTNGRFPNPDIGREYNPATVRNWLREVKSRQQPIAREIYSKLKRHHGW